MSSDQKNLKSDIGQTQATFGKALDSLVSEIGRCPEVLGLFPGHIQEDVLRLQLALDPPWRGGVYDIQLFERRVRLSEKLLQAFNNYWEEHQSSDGQRLLMCWLYFLHELHHTEQGVDSDTYPYTPGSLAIFMPLDYAADAFAVKCCLLLELSRRGANVECDIWAPMLVEILEAHIRGGEVFSYADGNRDPESIDGERLHRQLIWHFQYARARLFKPEASFLEFQLEQNILLEVFKVVAQPRRPNLCGEPAVAYTDLSSSLLEIHIKWGNQRILHSMTVPGLSESLARGVFRNELKGTVEAFRSLFSKRTDLIGRPYFLPRSPEVIPPRPLQVLRRASPPAPPQYFLGRGDDLVLLKSRLGVGKSAHDTGQVQTITSIEGLAGIGKSAMASAIGYDSELKTAFPDGIIWASLGQSPSLERELRNWGLHLRFRELAKAATLSDAVPLLREYLSSRRMLLIVDDVWDVRHAAPFRQALGKECAILFTTRVRPVSDNLELPDEAIHKLLPLSPDSAIELLSRYAERVAAEYDEECRQYLREIEYLPLAVVVAGRLLNAEWRKGGNVRRLLKELSKVVLEAFAPAHLIDLNLGTIPTVAALLRKSTDLLDERVRRCFAQLGELKARPATFDSDAMKAAWGMREDEDAWPVISLLLDHGLIEPVVMELADYPSPTNHSSGNRYQMHAIFHNLAQSLLNNESHGV